MEGQTPTRGRSRPPSLPPSSSRSRNGLRLNPQMSFQSSNSSASDLANASPKLKHAHLARRFEHPSGSGRRGSVSSGSDRPRSRVSGGTATDESRHSEPRSAVSSYLQEKLARERKVDSERSASRMSNGPDTTLNSGILRISPTRANTTDGERPQSSGGGSSKKKGLGLKEMEQTLTTLHKQNFDLKLELYYRRETQGKLEERIEKLEVEKKAWDAMNGKLLDELEKRDKAVEEAVAMIVTLEGRLDQLLEEREMVRRVDKQGYYPTPDVSDMAATPKMKHKENTLARMPSCLSEYSETTENLREVYLSNRNIGSVLSLPRLSSDTFDEQQAANMMGSPSMSILSESSFVSVYGQKKPSTSSQDHNGVDGASEPASRDVSGALSRKTPTRSRRSTSVTSNNAAGNFSSITELMDKNMNYSPLQRLEKMEKSLAAMNEASRAGSEEPEQQQASGYPPARRPRVSLRKVRTDAPPLSSDLNPHNLPPTPDTISTSTLRRYKNSNDTLSRDNTFANNERSYLALSEATSRSTSGDNPLAAWSAGPTPLVAQNPSISAFSSRRDGGTTGVLKSSSYFDNRLPIPPRPHSADESTVSRHGAARNDGWDSDSTDDIDGNDSASLHDYWMRESLRGEGQQQPNSQLQPAAHLRAKKNAHQSPDLFSFPAVGSGDGWATDVMFGHLGGAGYAPLSDALDALGDSLPTPQAGLFGAGLASPGPDGAVRPPPPPNRRSSLHAQTGSTSGTPVKATHAGAAKLRKSPVRSNAPRPPPMRRNSADEGATGLPFSQSQPVGVGGAEHQQPQKGSYYPPNPTRRLKNLFRRSGSHDQNSLPQAATQPDVNTAAQQQQQEVQVPMVGVPSWGNRRDLEEDQFASATPPPILRNPRVPGPPRRGSMPGAVGGEAVGEMPAVEEVQQPAVQDGGAKDVGGAHGPEGPAHAGGNKLKWLGRMSSLRNRAG